MLGFFPADSLRASLVPDRAGVIRPDVLRTTRVVLIGSAAVLLGLVLLQALTPFSMLKAMSDTDEKPLKGVTQWHGATLGGWLVMEINPTKADGIHPDQRPAWMFDQIAA